MDIARAIKRPFEELTKTVILSLLAIIPLVNFVAYGYALEIVRGVWKKRKTLPEWEDWGTLWLHGLMVFLIGLVYALPFLALVYLFRNSPLSLAIFAICGFITGIVWYAAILTYAEHYELSDAFALGDVFPQAFTGSFIGALVFSAVWSLVISIPAMIPLLGWLWWILFAGGAALITTFTLLAEAY